MPADWHDINTPGFPAGDSKGGGADSDEVRYLLACPAISDEAFDFERQYWAAPADGTAVALEKSRVTGLRWDHVDPARRGDGEASSGDRLWLFCDVEGRADGSPVRFEVTSETPWGEWIDLESATASLKGGTATCEIVLDLSGETAKEYMVSFTASVGGVYGGSCPIPIAPPLVTCDFIEIPDIHFTADSPMPCLDADGVLVTALAATLSFAWDNRDKETVLFGHTDTTGSPDHNYDVSKWRAEAVRAVLDGDPERWVDFAVTQANVEDQQRFLSALAKRHGWRCDPGLVDGKDGPKTRAGREAFQREYNDRFKGALAVDGLFGEKSWGAMFNVVCDLLRQTYAELTGREQMPRLLYAYGGKGVYPCGESFPIEEMGRDTCRSERNRRVEIVFFDKGCCPKLQEHTKKAEPVTKQECPVYDEKRTQRTAIDFAPVEVKPLDPAKMPDLAKTLVIPWVIDCHVHINSGHCSPLPLTWSKVGGVRLPQWAVDTVSTAVGGAPLVPITKDFAFIQRHPTDEVARMAVTASYGAIGDGGMEYLGEVRNRKRLLVNMPMDMDWAHYRGYEGRMIYEHVNGRTAYWNESKGKYYPVSLRDYDVWERYSEQLELTAKAFYGADGSLVSFYHYDPRAYKVNWRTPFEKNLVHTASGSRFPKNLPAIGIKMYTALGYRPIDPKLDFPWDDFYGLCASKNVPVLCHNSRGGMTTHDMLLYYDREHGESPNVTYDKRASWFTDEFVGPAAWNEVLGRHRDLRLCLAHFGGDTFWDAIKNSNGSSYWGDFESTDRGNWIAWYLRMMREYPNFYVDLSYFLFKPGMVGYFVDALKYCPEARDRILFGTDWWMIANEKPYGTRMDGYRRYVKDMCEAILSIDDTDLFSKIEVRSSRELLAYFMVLNPMRYLRLKEVVPKLAEAFYKDEGVKKRNARFHLADWINDIPETIAGFYA